MNFPGTFYWLTQSFSETKGVLKKTIWLGGMVFLLSASSGLASTNQIDAVQAGEAALKRGAWDQAIDLLTQALNSGRLSKSNRVQAHFFRGAAYQGKNLFDRALADYKEAVALNPDYAPAYNNRGIIFLYTSKNNQALADFDKAIALNPDKASAYNNRGLVKTSQGKDHFAGALADYNQAISLNPNNAEFYNNRGNVYLSQGRLERALADYDRAVSLAPKDAKAYNNRGAVFMFNGQNDRALEDLEKSLSLNPEYVLAINNRGKIFMEKGLYEQSVKEFDRALALYPQYTMAYRNRGPALFILGQFAQSEKDLETLNRMLPKFSYGILWRYLATERQGKNGGEVLRAQSKALDLQDWPGPVISFFLGAITADELMKKTQAAEKIVERRNRAQAFFYLGEFYLLRGDKNKAEKMFRQTLDSGNANLQEFHAAKAELERM